MRDMIREWDSQCKGEQRGRQKKEKTISKDLQRADSDFEDENDLPEKVALNQLMETRLNAAYPNFT